MRIAQVREKTMMSRAKSLRQVAIAVFTSLVCATPILAQSRTYAGIFNSRWRTVGFHGHDQPPCALHRRVYFPGAGFGDFSEPCDARDFARGNLDNSIGFRAGRERDFLSFGPLSLVGGAEAAMSYTEYNISQVDFALVSATVSTGADLHFGGIRFGARVGLAPFVTSDGHETGVASVRAVHLSIPIANGVAFRLTRETFNVIDRGRNSADISRLRRDPRAAETSFLLVSSPDQRGPSHWEFSAATGVTAPGGYFGSSRGLRKTAYSIVSVYRELPWAGLQARTSWTAAAQESSIASQYRGYDGNYRSKTINAFGLGVGRVHDLPGRFSRFAVRYSAGLDVADWRDNYQLLSRDGKTTQGGVEMGPNADLALRFRLSPHLAFETSLQKVYWRGIDVGEGRYSFGLVTTR
jgi:hypothetical protein